MVQTWFSRLQQLNWRCRGFIPRNLYQILRLLRFSSILRPLFFFFNMFFSLARLIQGHPGTLHDHTETTQGVFPVTSKVDTVITQKNLLLKFVSGLRKGRDLKTRDSLNACCRVSAQLHTSQVEHSEALQGPGKALRCFWVSSVAVWQHCWRTEDTTQRLQEQGW